MATELAPTIDGVAHLSFSVSDLDRSLHFYRDVLGLGVTAAPFRATAFDGREAILELPNGCCLNLQEHRRRLLGRFDERRCGLDHLAFAVEDLDEWLARLDRYGIRHSTVRSAEPSSGSIVSFRDPDGIQLELHCATAATG